MKFVIQLSMSYLFVKYAMRMQRCAVSAANIFSANNVSWSTRMMKMDVINMNHILHQKLPKAALCMYIQNKMHINIIIDKMKTYLHQRFIYIKNK